MTNLCKKKKIKLLVGLSLMILAVLVSACGGGGDDSAAVTPITYSGVTSQAILTDANAGQLALEAYTNGDAGESMALSLTDTNVAGTTSPHALAVAKLFTGFVNNNIEPNLNDAQLSGSAKAMQTVTGVDYGTCVPNGGSASYSVSADDSTGYFNGVINFSSYCEGGETISGSVTFAGQVDLVYEEFINFSMTFVRLTVSTGVDSYTASGSVTFSANIGSGTVTVDMVLLDGTTSKTYWVKDYQITATDYGTYEEINFIGKFYHPDEGYVELSTLMPLVVYYGESWPSDGQIQVTGINGYAILTATSTYYYVDVIYNDGGGTYNGPYTTWP